VGTVQKGFGHCVGSRGFCSLVFLGLVFLTAFGIATTARWYPQTGVVGVCYLAVYFDQVVDGVGFGSVAPMAHGPVC
jgi:hypothetical protein